MSDKNWSTVRVYRYEIGKVFDDDPVEVYRRWHRLRNEVRRACNIYVQAWMHWHYVQGHFTRLEELLEAFRAWEEADPKTRGPKPKWDVPAMPPNGEKPSLYSVVAGRCREITSDTVSTLCQIWRGNLLNGKDSAGKMKRWIAILLGIDGSPVTNRDLIIPIKPGSFDLLEDRRVCVQTSRQDVPGKKVGRVTRDTFAVRLPRRTTSGSTILDRCMSGEYRPRNASLMYSPGNRRWYFLLAYQSPATAVAASDPSRVARLRPHAEHPWEVELPDRTVWVGGDGKHVAAVRQKVFGQRESRHRNYRYAGSANKGHGRNRALAPVRRLERRWKDFVKSYNHEVTRTVVALCVEAGVGTLVYEQPVGEKRDEMYLAWAGRRGVRTQSFWDWFQIKTMLAYKCEGTPVHFVHEKIAASEAAEEFCAAAGA